MFRILKVWDSGYCFWLAGVLKIIIIFKKSYLHRSNSSVIAFMHTQLFRLSIFQTGNCFIFFSVLLQGQSQNFPPTATYLSICMYVPTFIDPPFSAPAATYCHLQICPQGPWSQSNKFFFCPSCQSISVISFLGVGRVCILSPSSGTKPLKKSKMGLITFQIISVPP